MVFVKRSTGVMRIFTDPPANHLDTLSFKGLIDIALLSLVKYLILLVRHWRAGQLNSHISKVLFAWHLFAFGLIGGGI